MKVDLYKRPDGHSNHSYLAVPSGKPIPEEATNTDWETELQNEELDANGYELLGVTSEQMQQQITDKGYAISSVQRIES